MNLEINISISDLWGEKVFNKNEWGYINFLVGPNGTGKSLFAEQLKQKCINIGLKTRYLNAERLAGLEKQHYGLLGGSGLGEGFNIHRSQEYHDQGKNFGLSADAIMTLKEKLDVRVKIEATLSQLFGRSIRLSEEGGNLKPMVQRVQGGNEYKLKENECHGLKELITLLTILYDDENNCLIIDEPELHLHPQFQSFFLQEIRQIAGDPRIDSHKKCFFLITHSPYLVDIRTIEDLKNCIVFQPDQIPAYIDQLDSDDEWKLKRLLPRLNTHHKQFFFASNPIFVEGYRDQQLFTLIQEKRGKLLGASGSCIIDVGGKEDLDLFYRLCKKLNINAKFITDLDVLFQGNLRQSVSKDDRCKGYLQSNGLGLDSMVTIGHAEQEISNCLMALVPTDTTKLDASCKQFFEALSGTTDVSKKRYIFLIGLKLIRDDLEKLIQKGETIKLIEGIIQKSIKAFEQCAVYVLPNGELENYMPYLTGNPYQISEKAKNDVFEKERDYIIGSDNCRDIEDRYRELIDILDKASNSKDVNFDEHLNYAIGEWIHKVQSAFIRGELKDKASIETNMRVEWKLYSRLFGLLDFVPNSEDFICKIKLRPIVDRKEREVAFDRKSVPANFNLKSLENSTNSA